MFGTYKDFYLWLLKQPKGEMVGRPGSTEECPVCRYLQEYTGRDDIQVRYRYVEDYGYKKLGRLDDVLIEVQYEFDHYLNMDLEPWTKEITREDALICLLAVLMRDEAPEWVKI